MDIVQFLLSVINLILAMVVLFGGRFFLEKVRELQVQIDELKHQLKIQKVVAQPIGSFLPTEKPEKTKKAPEWDV